jgi:hypothetical protein
MDLIPGLCFDESAKGASLVEGCKLLLKLRSLREARWKMTGGLSATAGVT